MGYREKKTVVHYWRYENGWRYLPSFLRRNPDEEREYSEDLKGWHCWVYPADDTEFEEWMTQNMKDECEFTYRFNSGNPMYTVIIKSDEDATLFKLKWM